MNYYKIELTTLPKVQLVLTKLNHYNYVYDGTNVSIELTYLHQNCTMEKQYADGKKESIPEGQTSIRIPGEKFSRKISYSNNHRLATLAFSGFDSVTITNAHEVTQIHQERISASTPLPTVFCLPAVLLQMPSKAYSLMQKMADFFVFGNSSKDLRMLSYLLQFLAEITDETAMQAYREINAEGLYSDTLYVNRVKQYISAHITEKFSVADIAAHIGISNAYLSRIFKAKTGHTLVSYINTVKLNAITELMDTRHFTLKEAGKRLGIENETYINRLFKKYIGMTSTEYRRLKNGQI